MAAAAQAADRKPEKHYQRRWCSEHGGRPEVALEDSTRCDCITATHAVEVDFAGKWAEALGQALHYASQTGKRAGILLVVLKPHDSVHLARLRRLVDYYGLPVDVWEER